MKFQHLFLVFILYISKGFGQWYLIEENIPDNPCFLDIQFATDDIGYVVSGNLIGKTIDGGESWVYNTTIDGEFTNIDFVNEDTGIICCNPIEGDAVIKTINGGTVWTFPAIESYDFYPSDIEVFPSGNVLVLDCFFPDVYVHHLNDFYTEYDESTLISSSASCFDLEFCKEDTGYVTGFFDIDEVTTRGAYTFDGGYTWFPSLSGLDAPQFKTSFPSSDTGYGIGAEAKVWKTWDYGNSWNLLPWDFGYGESASGFTIEDIYFYNTQIGFVITNNNIEPFDNHYEVLRTINGGISWDSTHFEEGEDRYVTEIFCTGADTCYMTTCNGGIFKTTNGAGFPVYPVSINENEKIKFSLYPNPSLSEINISFANRNEIKNIATANYLGEKINLDWNDLKADIQYLPEGIYITEIITDSGRGVQKWIKQ